MREPTFEEHAAASRALARSWGLADCIHYAPNWSSRADALCRFANSTGARWWEGRGAIGLLSDGRMALINDLVCIFEPL